VHVKCATCIRKHLPVISICMCMHVNVQAYVSVYLYVNSLCICTYVSIRMQVPNACMGILFIVVTLKRTTFMSQIIWLTEIPILIAMTNSVVLIWDDYISVCIIVYTSLNVQWCSLPLLYCTACAYTYFIFQLLHDMHVLITECNLTSLVNH
jgi:hypothetical protein